MRADAARPLSTMLRDTLGATGAADAIDAARVYVVTAALNPDLAGRLLACARSRRDVAVVWVDAPLLRRSRSAFPARPRRSLRLARAGVPVARLGAGDHVATALSSRRSLGGPALAERLWVLVAVSLLAAGTGRRLERPRRPG